MNIFGSSTLSPIDVVMMLSSRKIPYVLVANKILDDKCVFIFTSSSILESSIGWLKKKQGVVILLEIVPEIMRWKDIQFIKPEVTAAVLEHTISPEFGPILLKHRLPKEDQIRVALDTSDNGALKDVMGFLYSVKKAELRDRIKLDIFKWIVSEQDPKNLIKKIIGVLPKQNEESLKKLTTLEQCINGQSIQMIRQALILIREGMTTDEAAEECGVEAFELTYVQKFIDTH